MDSIQYKHRGAHPKDKTLFDSSQLSVLRKAVYDFSWLLSQGYAPHSALELVGNRYQLVSRQRMAVSRAACSDDSKKRRQASCLPIQEINNKMLIIDGFNQLISIEAALSGGVILNCRDTCIRDIASIHGSYHPVVETMPAITLIGQTLESFQPQNVVWLFDKPVSNSGCMVVLIRDMADRYGWQWQAQTCDDPDRKILAENKITVSSDSIILDKITHWVNLSAHLLTAHHQPSWIIDLAN